MTITGYRDAVLDAVGFRDFMRCWPSGVVVVTAGPTRRPSGCTVSAFLSVSLDPPLLLVSLHEHSRTLAAIVGRGSFGVNVLAWPQAELAARFAGPQPDRFTGVAQRADQPVPLLRDALAVAVCDVHRLVPVADHVLVLGTVGWCERGATGQPLVYVDRGYPGPPPSPVPGEAGP